MIVWQGFGFLVAVVGIAILAFTEYAVRAITKNEVYYQAHGEPQADQLGTTALLAAFAAGSPRSN